MEERIRNLEDKIKVLEQDNRDLKLGIKMLMDHHVKIAIAYNQQLYNQVTSRLHSMVNQHAKDELKRIKTTSTSDRSGLSELSGETGD